MTEKQIKECLDYILTNIQCMEFIILPESEKGLVCETITDALDLINRQQAEIERLNSCVKSEDEIRAIMKSQMTPMVKEITNEQIDIATKLARFNAILEFAERFISLIHTHQYILCDKHNSKDYGMFTNGIEQAINETEKEMVGEE